MGQSVGHAMTEAFDNLVGKLEEAIQVYKIGGYPTSHDTCTTIERFENEVSRVPAWAIELERRASFVSVQCRQGTAFRQRMDAAFNCYRAQARKPVGARLCGQSFIQRLRPPDGVQHMSDLARLIDDITCAEKVIPVPCRDKFRLWMDEARRIATMPST